jgi:hypothetical protein
MSQQIYFSLQRWNKNNGSDEGSADLYVTEEEVRQAFHLAANEYAGDCLEVLPEHIEWLKSKLCKVATTRDFKVNPEFPCDVTKWVWFYKPFVPMEIDLEQYDYSVDIWAETI